MFYNGRTDALYRASAEFGKVFARMLCRIPVPRTCPCESIETLREPSVRAVIGRSGVADDSRHLRLPRGDRIESWTARSRPANGREQERSPSRRPFLYVYRYRAFASQHPHCTCLTARNAFYPHPHTYCGVVLRGRTARAVPHSLVSYSDRRRPARGKT